MTGLIIHAAEQEISKEILLDVPTSIEDICGTSDNSFLLVGR